MGLTNFPGGVSSFGIPLLGSGPVFTTGTVFFVHSGIGSNDYSGTDPDRPVADLDTAINLATAVSSTHGGEDYIIVLPGHAETISAAAGADLDVDGIQVIGLGRGPNRPTITFATATGADIDIGADGVSLVNFLFSGTIDNQTSMIDIDAATGTLLEALEFRDSSSVGIDDTVDIADEVDTTIRNSRWYETDAGIGQSCILGTTPTRLTIQGCDFDKDAQTGIIELGNAVQVRILDNYIETSAPEDLAVVLGASATGWVDGNYVRLADDSNNITEAFTNTTNVQFGLNYIVNADGERVMEWNGTQSTDA